MKGFNRELRDKLLSAEKADISHKEKYKKELSMLLEDKMPSWQKIVGIIFAILISGQTFYFGYRLFMSGPRGIFPQIIDGLAVLFTGFCAGYLLWVATRKTINKKTQPLAAVKVHFVFALTFMIVILWHSMYLKSNLIVAVFIVLCGLFAMLMASVGLIYYQIKQSEIRTREKLLEIEYQVAGLLENGNNLKDNINA